jgi:hypothetical protein
MFRLPGGELSLDNPEAVKVPFGVAVAIAVFLNIGIQMLGSG